MANLLVVHGVNMGLLGDREKEIYGRSTLEDIDKKIHEMCDEMGITVDIFQSNHEGAIIDRIIGSIDLMAIIINPGALTYYSYAIRDCISGVGVPTVEVHMTNIFANDSLRGPSVITPVCAGLITGFGAESYLTAVKIAKKFIKKS